MTKPPPDDRTADNAIPASLSWPEPPSVAPSAPAETVAPTRRFDVPFELIAQTRPADIDLGTIGSPPAVDLGDGDDPVGDASGDAVAPLNPFAPEPEFSGGGDDNTGRFRLDDFMSAAGDTLMLGDPTQIVETAVIRSVISSADDSESDGGALHHETRICIGADIEAMLGPQTILLKRSDRPSAKLSPFELFVFSQLDGTMTVAGLSDSTGISAGDIRIALALLADKGQLEMLSATAAKPASTPPQPATSTSTSTTTSMSTAPTVPTTAVAGPDEGAAPSKPAAPDWLSGSEGPVAMDISNLLIEEPPPPPVIVSSSPTQSGPQVAVTATNPFDDAAAEAPQAPVAISRSFGRISVMRRVEGKSIDELSAFERHVLSCVDGERSVFAIIEASGLSESDVKVALELLGRRGVVEAAPPRADVAPSAPSPAPSSPPAPAPSSPAPSPPARSPASTAPTMTKTTAPTVGWRSESEASVLGLPGQALIGTKPPSTPPRPATSLPPQAFAVPAAFQAAPSTPPAPTASASATTTSSGLKAAFAPAAAIPVAAPASAANAPFSSPPSTGWSSSSATAQVERLLRNAAHAEQQGELDKAVVALRRAAELSPRSPMIHNRLGVALARHKDLPGAIAALGVALELQPNDPTILSNYTRIASLAEKEGQGSTKSSLWSRLRGK